MPQYARIQYESVYPGVDLVWYGNQRRLEYDFVVSPGADAKQIQVAYEGVESLQVEANGDLMLRTMLGEMRQQKPRVYQEIGGKRVEVAARYVIVARNRVSFALARYDRKRELRIDPVVLIYSTSFPTLSPYQATYYGAYDAFVIRLEPAGNVLVYSTYLGGSNSDQGYGIAVDALGSAYITGLTTSTNFPTLSPYQATYGGGYDAFVTKLTPAGNALVYSTHLGGNYGVQGEGIAVDARGSAYVTGWTYSTNFPTQSPYQVTRGGNYDVFVTKLTPAGNGLSYSTYLGGSSSDYGRGIAVDAAGSAYVTGYTTSTNFPTQSPYQGTFQGAFSTLSWPSCQASASAR